MIGAIGLTLHFPGDPAPTDVTAFVRDGSARFSERLFNDDKRSVQDTFTFSLKHDQVIVTKVRSATGRILVAVTDMATSNALFTGTLDPSVSQATAQVAESIGFEAVDSTWKLDVPIALSFSFPSAIGGTPYKVCDPEDTEHSLFHQLCYMAGYAANEVTAPIIESSTVAHCAAKAGEETYREFLDTLLFEHRLVLDDDGAGNITVRRWARIANVYDDTIQSGELSTVVPFTWSRRYLKEDGARIEWAQLQEMPQALLYRDSLPVSAGGEFTGKAIAAGDYYPPDSDIEERYQDYVEGWLDKPYLERVTRLKNRDISLVATDGQSVVFTADPEIALDLQQFEPHRARIRFLNSSGATASIYTFEVLGKALFRSSIQRVLAPATALEPREYTSRFLFNADAATALASSLALDALYGDFEYTFGLNRYVQSGTIVRIFSEKNNIDTLAIIQECSYDSMRPVYQYTAVGVAEWSSTVAATGSGSVSAALWPIMQAIDAKASSIGAATPPSNNVTNVVFSHSQNADGTVRVAVSFDYVQGVSKADAAHIYVKASVAAPSAFDYSIDRSEAQAISVDGSYGWTGNFPVRIGGGVGGSPWVYRFGVVAGNGALLHVAGAVTPPGWEAMIFASKLEDIDIDIYDTALTAYYGSGKDREFVRLFEAAIQFGRSPELEGETVVGSIDLNPGATYPVAQSLAAAIRLASPTLTPKTAPNALTRASRGVTYNGKILYVSTNAYSLEIYDPIADTWTYKSIPTQSHVAMVVYKDKVYLPCSNGTNYRVEIYDLLSDSWSLITAPHLMQAFKVLAFQNKIWFFAGTGVVSAFDVGTSTWHYVGLGLGTEGSLSDVVVVGNKLVWMNSTHAGIISFQNFIAQGTGAIDTIVTKPVSFSANDMIVVGGVVYLPDYQNSIMRMFDIQSQAFSSVTVPAVAIQFILGEHDGYIYVLSTNSIPSLLHRFDTRNKTNTPLTLPSVLIPATRAFYNGKFYCFNSGATTSMTVLAVVEFGAIGGGFVGKGTDGTGDYYDLYDGTKLYKPKAMKYVLVNAGSAVSVTTINMPNMDLGDLVFVRIYGRKNSTSATIYFSTPTYVAGQNFRIWRATIGASLAIGVTTSGSSLKYLGADWYLSSGSTIYGPTIAANNYFEWTCIIERVT